MRICASTLRISYFAPLDVLLDFRFFSDSPFTVTILGAASEVWTLRPNSKRASQTPLECSFRRFRTATQSCTHTMNVYPHMREQFGDANRFEPIALKVRRLLKMKGESHDCLTPSVYGYSLPENSQIPWVRFRAGAVQKRCKSFLKSHATTRHAPLHLQMALHDGGSRL